MDLRQLRYFAVLAEQQHFGRASSMLHLAPPALSRQIRLLEEELGVRLFERHARGATPTPEARFLEERTLFVLRYVEQLKHEMMARQKEPQGPVTMGLSSGLAQVLAVPLTQAMAARYPRVRLKLHEAFAPALHGSLLSGGLDLAVLIIPVPPADVTVLPLLEESICLIGRPADMPANNGRIRIKSLAGLPLVLTGLPKSGVRLEVEAAAVRAGVTLTPVVEVETMQVAKLLVSAGVGLTVHFATGVRQEIAAGKLVAVPIEKLSLRRALVRSSVRPLLRATEALIEILGDVVRAEVQEGRWPNAKLQLTDRAAPFGAARRPVRPGA